VDELWLLIALSAVVTFASRLVGVVLIGRVATAERLLQWVVCVAYALLAGLVSRMLVQPIGPLAHTEPLVRLAGVAAGLVVWLVFRRNVLLGVLAGTATLAWLAA
jgi:branched-subunit amino acid transport protein